MLGEVGDAMQYFSKCLESGKIVCLDRRLMIEASDNLQKAQVLGSIFARIEVLMLSLFY